MFNLLKSTNLQQHGSSSFPQPHSAVPRVRRVGGTTRRPPRANQPTTLLMSTGLTMGTISSLFRCQTGIINQAQFSVLVAGAVFPTFLAQRYFHPHHLLDALPGGKVDPEFLGSAPRNR